MKKTYLIILGVALATGTLVALFLKLLHAAIHYRFAHSWLIYLLPLAGLLIYYLYALAGKSAEKGNDLIIDEIHQPGAGVVARMGPLVLLTTVITHLFGGSAGREGTAVQIGGSVAAALLRLFQLPAKDVGLVLTCGIAAGFGAVFGTPLTGAIFAIEVLTLRRMKPEALVPALMASVVADWTVGLWGVHHHPYQIDVVVKTFLAYSFLPNDLLLLGKVGLAAVAFGLAGLLFASAVHQLKAIFLQVIKVKWLIPVIGGSLVILLTYINGKPDYLSLGVDAEYPGAITISSAFMTDGAATWSWLWKTLYTTVTLSTGFKGGEVTPLFYIGATLGNTLSTFLHAPVSLFAALGFVAVFAGATKTPLACTLMGMELFGAEYGCYFAFACFVAYFFSGHTGIYASQRKYSKGIGEWKGNWPTRLREYRFIKLDKYTPKFSSKPKSE